MDIKKLYERYEEIEKVLESGGVENLESLEKEQELIENAISIMEENEIDKVERIIVSSISWDAPKSAKLPKKVTIDINLKNIDLLDDINGAADNVSDYLSDTYEYCHYGFCVDIE